MIIFRGLQAVENFSSKSGKWDAEIWEVKVIKGRSVGWRGRGPNLKKNSLE